MTSSTNNSVTFISGTRPVSTRPGRRRPRTVISTVGWKARAPPLEAFASFWREQTFLDTAEEQTASGSNVINDAVDLSQDDVHQQNAMEVDTPSETPQVEAIAAPSATAEKALTAPAPVTDKRANPPEKEKTAAQVSHSERRDLEDSLFEDVEAAIATEEAKNSTVPEEAQLDKAPPVEGSGAPAIDLENSILQDIEKSIEADETKDATMTENQQDKEKTPVDASRPSLVEMEDSILQDLETSIVRAEEEAELMTELEEGLKDSVENEKGGEAKEAQRNVPRPLDNRSDKSHTTQNDWKKKPPSPGEPHERTENGIVYKWCQNCFGGRGTWRHGANAHLTADHKSPGELLWERAEQAQQQANPGNWKKTRPGPGEPLERNDNGSIYRWCDLCNKGKGGWNYGPRAHFTEEHKRPRELAMHNREMARTAKENSNTHAPTNHDPSRGSMDPMQAGYPSSRKRPLVETNPSPPSKLPRRTSSSFQHNGSTNPNEEQRHDSTAREASLTIRLPRASEELNVATNKFHSEVVDEFRRADAEGKTLHATLSMDKEYPESFSLSATAVDRATLTRFEQCAIRWAQTRSQELLSHQKVIDGNTSLSPGSKSAPDPSPQKAHLPAPPLGQTGRKKQLPELTEKPPKPPTQELVLQNVDPHTTKEPPVAANSPPKATMLPGVSVLDATESSASKSPVKTAAVDPSQTTNSSRSSPSSKKPSISIVLDRMSSVMHPQKIFTMKEFQKDLVEVYKKLHKNWAEFEAHIAIHPQRAEKYLVTLTGNPNHYVLFESMAFRWVGFKDKLLQMKCTMADEASHLLDVEVDMARSIGATLTIDPLLKGSTKPLDGVWFDKATVDGDLSRKLGFVENLRGVILSIDGKASRTAFGVQEVILKSKSKGCKTAIISLCLPKDVDLSKGSMPAVRNLRRGRFLQEAATEKDYSSTSELETQRNDRQATPKSDEMSSGTIPLHGMADTRLKQRVEHQAVPNKEQEKQALSKESEVSKNSSTVRHLPNPRNLDHPKVETVQPPANNSGAPQNVSKPNIPVLKQGSAHPSSGRGLQGTESTAVNPPITQPDALQNKKGVSPGNSDLSQRRSRPEGNVEPVNNPERRHRKFLSEICGDTRSVQITVSFPPKGPLGGSLRYPHGMNIGCLYNMKSGGALSQVLGPDVCGSFVAVVSVNGMKPRTIEEFKAMKLEAQNSGKLDLVLLVPDGTNLSKIDKTKLLGPPRRRNGEPIGSNPGQGNEKTNRTEVSRPRMAQAQLTETSLSSIGVPKILSHTEAQVRSTAVAQVDNPSEQNEKGSMERDTKEQAQPGVISRSGRATTTKPAQVLNPDIKRDTKSSDISTGGPSTGTNSHRTVEVKARDDNKSQPVGLQEQSATNQQHTSIDRATSTSGAVLPRSNNAQQIADSSANKLTDAGQNENNTGAAGVEESGPLAGTETEPSFEANNDTFDSAGAEQNAEVSETSVNPVDTPQAKPSQSQINQEHRGMGHPKSDFFRVSPARRKERTANLKELSQPILGTTSSALARRRSNDRSQSIGLRGPNRHISRNLSNSQPSYVEATFDPHKGLGAYFDTVNNTCKISSIWYSGQVAKHYRIRTGMVVAFCDNGRDIQIRNHMQLKRLYDEARRAGRKLKLKLLPLSTDPDGSLSFDSSMHDKDWTFDGKWKGNSNEGWDGGTDMEWRMESPTYQKSPIVEEEATPEEEEEEEYVPPDPIEIISSESESSTESEDSDDIADDAILVSSHVERLRHAVQEESCAKVIEALEDNALSDKDVVENGLKNIYDDLKERLVRKILDHKKNKGDRVLEKEIHELQGKKTVLNIFINAEYCLEKVFGLEDWAWFEIRLKNAAVDFLGNDYEQVNTVGEVRVRIEDKQTILNFIPNFFSPGEIDFDQRGDIETAKTTNNARIAMKKRYLEVEFVDANNPDVQLCLFQTPMNRVSEVCPRCNEPALIEIPPMQTDPRVVSCEVVMEVCRIHADGKYMLDKTKESAKAITDQLDHIARFNSEHSDLKVNPNVKGKDGITLLHAAIHIRRVDLVMRLLEMGADPTSKSSKGTPLKMTVAAVQKVKKKIGQLEKAKAPPAAIAMKRSLLEDFEAILTSLRDAMH
eukprot:Nitzschia sp. Nitz4//scaffold46_size129759//2610//9045//NITZ4_003479-RA/size129759-snap-gene-0.2-mRNA-1//1//CDS//3329552529//5972//frame0